jgi:hypothetical protein
MNQCHHLHAKIDLGTYTVDEANMTKSQVIAFHHTIYLSGEDGVSSFMAFKDPGQPKSLSRLSRGLLRAI